MAREHGGMWLKARSSLTIRWRKTVMAGGESVMVKWTLILTDLLRTVTVGGIVRAEK